MSSVITLDFEHWKAQEAATGNPVVLDEFVFANIPGLDPTLPIDRNEKLPPENQIVHRQRVNKTGLASENAVAYSVTIGTEVGDFEFNWIGLLNKATGIIAMITHAPIQKKIKTHDGLQGNVLTRSFLLEFEGAAKETAINTTAETWQIDFTARLSGIDEQQRLINVDTYGDAAFFDDGFLVSHYANQYTVKRGLAYVGGLRGELKQDQIFTALRDTHIYADFSFQGNLLSQWETKVKLTPAKHLSNYADIAGFQHFVSAIAHIDADGKIADLRSIDSKINQKIKELQESKVDNNNIVDKTGNSENKIMSQAAVTAELDKRLEKDSLRNEDAASNINTSSGKSIQSELNILAGSSALYPEMYITALEVDHTEAFKRMFNDAKKLKRRVQAFGNYTLSSSIDGITISVPTDFSQATITCRSKETVLDWLQKTYIFTVTQDYENITHQFKSMDFVTGSIQSSIMNLNGFIKLSSDDVVLIRYENENTPTNQYKCETNEIFENGQLKYINHYQHGSKTKLEYKPYLNKLLIELPNFILEGAFIRSIIKVTRNNTTLKGGVIQTKSNGHCQAYIENEDSCKFEANDITLSLDYSSLNKGGYAITFKNTSTMILNNIVDAHGWSGVDGNCYRGLRVNDSHLLTVGGHFSVSDIHVDKSTIINHCNGQGWGEFRITRCRHLCADNDNSKTVTTFSTKYDYGNSWEGNIIIDDLEVIIGNKTKNYYIVSAMEPKYNHEFIGHCPDIFIENIRINVGKLTYNPNSITTIRFIDLGKSREMGFEQYQILPRYHEIKNVKLIGNRYFERIDVNPVFNFRDYSNLTRAQINTISGAHYLYTLTVSDLNVEKAGRANGSDIAACYVQGFRFTEHDIPQQIDIINSNYCIPCVSAWNNMNINVRNQIQNHVIYDNSIMGNISSYNIVKYKECTIFGTRVLGARENRSAFLDFHDCHFDFISRSRNQPMTIDDYDKNNGFGLVYSDSPVVTSRLNECTAALEAPDKTYDPKFKQWIKENYKLNGYYL